ncbi:toll/interleukin-1 receptor domain-containing protein [Sphingobium sp. AS12]|uniref:toll/interleukin-1 receptor domain-containing protein n=1 Tax=Sphingobium sp. AS12 TaxID=2849495 RepID=UPI001C31E355|nr:toll/interleukin-1 receptor domain-containing protein [Sphingobium sp. AS12]MBV2149056.1 toll/interleukin-1 receptor domain-containing protein [Sphingobium sp. AS12]
MTDVTSLLNEVEAGSDLTRRTVFISHANPEDNEFTAWLGTRLIGAGYHVWSDLLRLIGGEPFWRDIGDAIKDYAEVVVLVLSRASVQKPGVLDEIALAVATSRKLKNPKFIIPVRLDDLPYDEFPEQVIRLNAINFNGNWADGLHRLFEALDERAVTKGEEDHMQGIAEFRNFRLRQSAAISAEPETVEGTWLQIRSLPGKAYLSRYGSDAKTVAKALGRFNTPVVAWDRLGLGFAKASEIIEVETPDLSVEHGYDVDLQKFVAGEASGSPQLRGVDARRMIANLLRQAWERFATEKGLLPYAFANSTGWYVPRGLIEKDTVTFVDRTGRKRRKRLSGRSEKRKVYWSFAVTMHPVVGRRWHLELKPQVVFTEDGIKPVENKATMARLRKSFCKNWWNDQWRTLLNAYIRFLADEDGDIHIPLGVGAAMVVAGELMAFEAPTSIVGDSIAIEEEEAETDTAADQLDDGIDFLDADEFGEVEA